MSELTVKLKNEFRGGEGRPLLWPCVAALAAAFLLLLLGRELLTIMKIDVWRFDAVYNFDDYFSYKFRTEGRWLVCLLFPLLRLVPAHLSILLHLACLWLFGYCCCRNFTEDRAYSALFGLALLQIHPYFSIFGWPTTTLPTVLCLAGLALARDKLPLPWFFVAGGVLFHGGFNNFYDLLPLLFLDQIRDRDWKYLLKLFVWWCVGYTIGCAAAEASVYIFTGHPVEISPWRDPQPVKSLSDALRNACKMGGYLRDHAAILFSRRLTQFAAGAGLGISLFAGWRRRPELARLYLTLLAVVLSVYAQTLPVGIKISFRTSFPLYMAVLSVYILCSGTRVRTAAIVLLCVLAFGLFQDDVRTADYYYTVTSTYKNEFLKEFGAPAKYTGLRFIASNDDMKALEAIVRRRYDLENKLTEGFGSAMRWSPVAQTCGVAGVTYEDAIPELPQRSPRYMYVYKLVGNYLIMGVNPAYLKANAGQTAK